MNERGPARRLSIHLCLLGVLLVALLATSELKSGFSVDEGSYAIQAHAVRDGGWEINWPFRAIDPDGAHFPYHAGRLSPDGEYAYVSHPLWPQVLAWVTSLTGDEEVGLRVLSLLAVLGAACAGFLLARLVAGPAAAVWGFWIVAASPVLPNGLMIWAHAPAIALAGAATLAALKGVLAPKARWPWLVLPTALALGSLVRSESLLYAAALIGALGLTGVRSRDRRIVLLAGIAGVAISGAFLGERAWTTSILGEYGTIGLADRVDSESGWILGRVAGAFVVSVLGGESAATVLVMFVALWMVVVAALGLDRPDMRMRPAPLLWLASGLVVIRVVLGPTEPAYGLLVAWPVIVFAIIGVRGGGPAARLVGTTGLLFVVAVLLTQWDGGGGPQWGGRYLSPLLVPMSAMTAALITSGRLKPAERRAVAGLIVVCALAGMVITDQARRVNVRGMEQVTATGAITALANEDQFARLDWRRWPERCWIAANEDLAGAVATLARAGSGRVAYVDFTRRRLRRLGLDVIELDRDLEIGVISGREKPLPCPARGVG